jgi:hypothetical protein
MRPFPSAWLKLGLLLVPVSCWGAADTPVPTNLIDQAQKQVVDYIGKLADLHCTEDVTQQKLKPNGYIDVSRHSQYDYFLYMQGSSYDFQLSESRLEVGTSKPAHAPMLLSNGFSTLLLVFHPYYRNAFEFTAEPVVSLEGRLVVPVHYAHIQGARTPAALALRGREFPLELEGTAWLDSSTGQVVRMDAGLEHEMADVGLKALKIEVDYMPAPKSSDNFMVPAKAVVDLETPKQHWKNTHTFHNYKLFSIEATQDPAVKVKPEQADPNAAPSSTPQ